MSELLTAAMSHLDDNHSTLDEEFYLEQGRLLAAAQDATPQLFRIVCFTADAPEDGHAAAMRRHETLAVAVDPHNEDRSSGGGRLSARELLERGMCRASWLERTFPQLSRQSDCLLLSMVPYVDNMFGVEV